MLKYESTVLAGMYHPRHSAPITLASIIPWAMVALDPDVVSTGPPLSPLLNALRLEPWYP